MQPTATLPDGRRISIADALYDRLLCGVLVIDPVVVDQRRDAVDAASRLGIELTESYADLPPSRIPGLTEARNLYKSCGMEPTRHRPSSEALLRRVLKGKGLYHISNVVDSCNLASLRFLLPIGMYDLDLIDGDVTLQLGAEGDQYDGIRKGPVHLGGRLGLYDRSGPFGSPTSDSARTCVTDATRRLLAVVMATATYRSADMAANLEIFSGIFADYCNGETIWQTLLGKEAA